MRENERRKSGIRSTSVERNAERTGKRDTGTRVVRRSLGAGLAMVVASLVGITAAGAAGHDPSKITASCFASASESGLFSGTAPLTLFAGSDVIFKLGYRNNDLGSDDTYPANFSAHLRASAAFGLARDVDTAQFSGGQGFGSGTVRDVHVGPAEGSGTESVLLEITSDVTGSAVLARCAFQLTVVAVNDDVDGDGIANAVEIGGLRDAQGNLVLQADGQPAADFPSLGANPCRKDLFVEVDYQGTGPNGHNHQPGQASFDEVEHAFADAPLVAPSGCPFASFRAEPGIKLHVEVDDTLPPPTVLDGQVQEFVCQNVDFTKFDPARRPYFIYGIYVEKSLGFSTGLAPCNDLNRTARAFIVSVGGVNPSGNRLQSGTFMHELGHVLGLGHGGDTLVNLKPNYLSVMNYSFQAGIGTGTGSVIDYSRARLPTLDEAALDENLGIGHGASPVGVPPGPPDLHTFWWGPQPGFHYQQPDQLVGNDAFGFSSKPFRASGPLDWNQNGHYDTSVSVDINSDGLCVNPGSNLRSETTVANDDVRVGGQIWNGANRVCDSRPAPASDDLLAASPQSRCVTNGPDRHLDTTADTNDIAIEAGTAIGLGSDLKCDSTAVGDDVQETAVGRGEPLLTGFDDWNAIDWRIGPSRAAPAPGVSLPPVAPHRDQSLEDLTALLVADQPRPPTVTGIPDRWPNNIGWYDAPVTIDWQVSADGGRATDPPDTIALTEGTNRYTSDPSCDALNNCATGQVILSIDLSDPSIICSPASFVLNQPGATVSATVVDTISGPIATSASVPVSTSTIGTASVPLSGTDRAGRTTTRSCPYTVSYNFTGFSQPVDNNDVLNTANAGQTIPLKWRLTDFNGNPVTNLTSAAVTVTVTTLPCAAGTTADAVEEYATGTSGLQHLGDGNYQWNWKTPKAYAKSCKKMHLALGEHLSHDALFQFVK